MSKGKKCPKCRAKLKEAPTATYCPRCGWSKRKEPSNWEKFMGML